MAKTNDQEIVRQTNDKAVGNGGPFKTSEPAEPEAAQSAEDATSAPTADAEPEAAQSAEDATSAPTADAEPEAAQSAEYATSAPTADAEPEAAEGEETQTSAPTAGAEPETTETVEVATPAPTAGAQENDSSEGKGNVAFLIIGVAIVIAAAAILLKRCWFDGKGGRKGRAQPLSQTGDGAGGLKGGKLPVRTKATADAIDTTMNEDGSAIQSHYSVGHAQWIGKRDDQEDAYLVSDWKDMNAVIQRGILAAVADGIGGLDDGQIASQSLIQSFWDGFEALNPELPPQEKLLELLARGQHEVWNINRQGKRCGTTLVAALIQDDLLSIISVGDSRIALYRSGVLLQLNREHVNARGRDEQSALNGAERVEGKRRVALTSYVGKDELYEIDRNLNPIRLVPGDCVLLMSDGVFGTLNDDQLTSLLDQDPQQAANEIIEAVQKQRLQYQDNATVIVIRVL